MKLFESIRRAYVAFVALFGPPFARLKYLIQCQALVFVLDTRGEATEFTAPIMMVISGIIWVICTPIFVNQVQATSTSGWNFTGSAGAITLFQLLPFIFIAGGVIWIVRKAMS